MELSPKGHWKVAARKNQGPTSAVMSFWRPRYPCRPHEGKREGAATRQLPKGQASGAAPIPPEKGDGDEKG